MIDPSAAPPQDLPAAFERLVNLASARIGAVALAANDDFFAPRQRLLRADEPRWRADAYTARGKWMDGWETRRRRTPGHDWCLIRLGLAGRIHGVVVDTRFFRGNFPAACSIEACDAPADAPLEWLESAPCAWEEILPQAPLAGDTRNRFALDVPWRFSHLRLRIYPDGGVARLRVHGEPLPEPGTLRETRGLVDLAALAHGAAVTAASDEFFGSRHHLVLPGASRGMADGWETRRRRGPGHDWALVKLAAEGVIEHAVVDTSHFKGNAPGQVAIEVAAEVAALDQASVTGAPWRALLPEVRVRAHRRHHFARRLLAAGPARAARLRILPDGGVARLRLFGTLTERGRAELGLRWLGALAPGPAAAALRACVGGERWAERVLAARPYADLAALLAAAESAAGALTREDWLACFATHPRIGESREAAQADARERSFSAAEQSAAHDADDRVSRALAAGNRRYEERFGHVFLIAAAGRGAREILAELERRSALSPGEEFENAVREERRIAARRLRRMVTGREETP